MTIATGWTYEAIAIPRSMNPPIALPSLGHSIILKQTGCKIKINEYEALTHT